MVALLATLACVGPVPTTEPGRLLTDDWSRPAPADDAATAEEGHTTESAREEPSEIVDVLVIGGGPSGLAAAYTAAEASLTVRVLEKEAKPNGSGPYAGRYFAVGTDTQAALGIADDRDRAIADWPTLSGGVVDDHVIQLIDRSASVLAWIEDDLGGEITGLGNDPGETTVARLHAAGVQPLGPAGVLSERLDDRILLETRGTALVFDGDRVVGCRWEDADGDTGWIRADAVVVAAGGFARSLADVARDRPELATIPYLAEIGPPADGTAIPLLEDAGAQWQNRGNLGIYTHAIEDPGRPGEALWPVGLQYGIFLDSAGHRVANEEDMAGFELVRTLLDLPDHRIIAVVPENSLSEISIPKYNVAAGESMYYPLADLVDLGIIQRFSTADALAAGLSMDRTTVRATFARYDALVRAGSDPDFHKSRASLKGVVGQTLYAFDLVPGAAKGFSGFAVDLGGRITAADGTPIPGLYAAGETIGMLGSAGAGRGFAGSITAVYLTGIVAGETVIADRG